jgi:hypothetical protein
VRERNPLDIIPGMVAGAVLGVLFLLFFFIDIVFPGDVVILGAIVGGILGYLLGNDFFVWFRDRSWWW